MFLVYKSAASSLYSFSYFLWTTATPVIDNRRAGRLSLPRGRCFKEQSPYLIKEKMLQMCRNKLQLLSFLQWKSDIFQNVLPNSVAEAPLNVWHLEVALLCSLKRKFFFKSFCCMIPNTVHYLFSSSFFKFWVTLHIILTSGSSLVSITIFCYLFDLIHLVVMEISLQQVWGHLAFVIFIYLDSLINVRIHFLLSNKSSQNRVTSAIDFSKWIEMQILHSGWMDRWYTSHH